MGFFGSEFVDVRRELGGAGTRSDLLLTPDHISAWGRRYPNGLMLYFAPGRYILPRVRERYGIWNADYDFPQGCNLWMDESAELVFESARILIRGEIIAPLSRIFLHESGVDGPSLPPSFVPTSGMVLIESNLPAVYPEWWGAVPGPSPTNHEAINAAILTASTLRNPLTSRNTSANEQPSISWDYPRPLPPLPVVFTQLYHTMEPVVGGRAVRLADARWLRPGASVDALEFGNDGYITVILRGQRIGGRGPAAGLRYAGLSAADQAVLHLRNSYGATVESLIVDGGDRAGIGVYLEPTGRVPQMHSVLLRRNHILRCARTAIQVGPIAANTADLATTRVVANESVGVTVTRPVEVVVPSIPFRKADGWLDMPGLQIEQCEIECGVSSLDELRPTLGIQLRAANGVANLISGCRFRGHATAFVEAVATYSLIERCDFANQHYAQNPAGEPLLRQAESRPGDAGSLGFEPPDGSDVYLGLDPVIRPVGVGAGTATTLPLANIIRPPTEGAVMMHACTSTSLAMFSTVRPGPFDYKRSERTNMILGCVHRVDARAFPRWGSLPAAMRPASVSWGRTRYSGYRVVTGSPGYNPDPCFTCVGNHLENGVEVYFGAPQCAFVANHTDTGSPPRLTNARPGIRAITYIFGIATMLALMLCGGGCANSATNSDAGPPPPDDIVRDVRVQDAGERPDRSVVIDGATDAGQIPASDMPVTGQDLPPDRPPLDVPGALPIDGYPPPSQQRHRCPVSTEGDPGIPAPRLVGPMSPLRMTSQRPTLRWELAPGLTGAQIELCRDPCCQQVITTLQAIGDHARPIRPLAQGVVFWRARGMVGSWVGRDLSFTWEFGVPHRDSTIDTFKGSIHDFNGDGFDDVVVSFSRHVRVYWGGVGGLAGDRYTDYRLTDYDPSPTLTVGDVNADGFADVIAGQNYLNPRTGVGYTRLEVFNGSRVGLVSDSPDHIVGGFRVDLGDINGDGFADGITNRQRNLLSSDVSEATVLFGGQAGLGAGGMMRISDPRGTRSPEAAFGSPSAVGDADGDGYADAVIGAVNEDRFAGAVYVYRGGASGLAPTPARRIPTMIDAPRESRWGERIYCIGDINHDGLADFHVAARGETIPVFVGSRAGVLTHAFNAEIPGSSDSISIWSAAATDLDGDGDQDGYWGCTTCYGVNDDGGEIGQLGHVVLLSEGDGGPAVTTIRPPPYPANESDRTYYFGQGVVAVDVDGDGWDDLVTINPESYSPPRWLGRGRVSIYFGGLGVWGRAVHFYVTPERDDLGAGNLT